MKKVNSSFWILVRSSQNIKMRQIWLYFWGTYITNEDWYHGFILKLRKIILKIALFSYKMLKAYSFYVISYNARHSNKTSFYNVIKSTMANMLMHLLIEQRKIILK